MAVLRRVGIQCGFTNDPMNIILQFQRECVSLISLFRLLLTDIFHIRVIFETFLMNNLSRSDYQLLRALQNDLSVSQIDLAERSGMSRSSVWRRIRELE